MVGQDWDEVVELSYAPSLVSGALEALASRAEHRTLVSTVSVYASNSEPGAGEGATLLPVEDTDDYGQAKVAAERATRTALGDRLLVARAGLIGGPGDGSDRFGYWVSRYRGEMVTCSDDWLIEHDVGYWAGPRSLPLWVPMTDAAVAQRDTTALQASLTALGITLSPLADAGADPGRRAVPWPGPGPALRAQPRGRARAARS